MAACGGAIVAAAGLPATIGMDGRVMYRRMSDIPRYNME